MSMKPLHQRLEEFRAGKPGATIEVSRNGEGPIIVNMTNVIRLSEDQCKALEATLPKPYADNDTTAHNAGFLLGIQHVMHKLREGFVVG